ncbi:MAG: ABC transporter substrate-binding protein [Galactobacter sp.]|uniref:ABC transporter substrate-binding protein n=1 Tax=Galactobacter sp. TaxID=2676125 RepID=UPI0025BA5723|nr:ABC transporter substrate-binding protein [Galactobacter sp.]
MKKKPILALTGMTMAGLMALTACGGGGGNSGGGNGGGGSSDPSVTRNVDAKTEEGGTMYQLLNAPYSHLDPAQGFDGGVNNFYRLIYRQLTTVGGGGDDEPNKVTPDLATDTGTPNEDNTEWKFTLKDDIFFEDGTPITSKDVKFGVERSLDPAVSIGSPYARLTLDIPKDYKGYYQSGGLDSIETPDDKTIVFHLAKPYADFPSVVGQAPFTPFPVSQAKKITTTSVDKQPVASGPYRVVENKIGSKLVLERNKYWKKETDEVRTAKPDSWEFTFGLDPATIDERMLAGQGDDANAVGGRVQASAVARLQQPQVSSRVVSGLQGCTTYLAMNTTKKGMDDPKVRQAINYAIDRQAVTDALGGNQLSQVATTMLPPTVEGHEDFDLYPSKDDKGDIDKAKELLKEAGYEDGLTITLDVRSEPKWTKGSEAVQASLKKAGITVKFNPIDTSTYYEVIGTTAQQHDAAITGWCPDWPTGATFLPPIFEGSQIYAKGNQNVAQFDDKGINTRMEEIRKIKDVDEANAEWGKLDKEILEKAPAAPLAWEQNVSIVGENVGDAYSHPGYSGGIDFAVVGLKDAGK